MGPRWVRLPRTSPEYRDRMPSRRSHLPYYHVFPFYLRYIIASYIFVLSRERTITGLARRALPQVFGPELGWRPSWRRERNSKALPLWRGFVVTGGRLFAPPGLCRLPGYFYAPFRCHFGRPCLAALQAAFAAKGNGSLVLAEIGTIRGAILDLAGENVPN